MFLNRKKVFIYYIIVLFVSMLFSVTMDVVVYKNRFEIDNLYFLSNLGLYTPVILFSIWIVDLFNTKYNSFKLYFKIIIEIICLYIVFSVMLVIASYFTFIASGVAFNLKDWFEMKVMNDYFTVDVLETFVVLLFTKIVYLYDKQRLFETERERYKYNQLKSQLNPHFLFNSLSTLYAMIYTKKSDEIANYVSSLSDIYRYVLSNEKKNIITLREELDFVNNYIGILRQRFGDNMIVDIDIAEKKKNREILPMSLQLLIENAVKHNTAEANNPVKIRIYDDKDCIVVVNNINPKMEFNIKKSGIGLQNLIQRYDYYVKRNIEIENSKEIFKVKIPII